MVKWHSQKKPLTGNVAEMEVGFFVHVLIRRIFAKKEKKK
jgi:hypothetical protein